MNYNMHKIGGVSSALALSMLSHKYNLYYQFPIHSDSIMFTNNPDLSLICSLSLLFLSAYFSSTLADIDHPQSQLGRKYPKISHFLNTHGGHRGITHRPLLLMIFAILFIYIYISIRSLLLKNICFWLFLGFLGGYISHLFLDLFNSAGLQVLMPFSKMYLRIPTGITIKQVKGKKKVCWRYLKGGTILDNLIMFALLGGGLFIEYCLMYGK